MLFTQADGGNEAFNSFVLKLSQKLLPNFEWMDLPAEHEIYTLNYRVEPRPKLRCISNGSRILMLHSPVGLSQYWQFRSEKTHRPVVWLGVHLFLYAAREADFRYRLIF